MNRIAHATSLPSKKKQNTKSKPAAIPAAIRQWVIGGTCALMSGLPVMAQAQPQVQAQQAFDVGAGELKPALDAYIAQGGVQLLYKVDDVKGMVTRGVKGALTPQEALSRILEGTPLLTRRGDDGAVVIYAAAPVAAAAARPSTEEPQSLDSVTVTATRRREPVREVPMQVNVMKAETLERAGARNLANYIAEQPGVNLTSSGTVGGVLSMRGLTTGPTQTVATVGVYNDDVATGLSSSYALGGFTPLDMGMLDLNHVEILRGPQGTLYGAGAMGGVLKYVTNQPDSTEFSGMVRFGASSTTGAGPGYTLNSVLNIPIKEDVAAIRLAAFTDRVGGSYSASGAAAGANVDRGHTDGGRVSLLVTPTRELSIRLTATTQDVKRDGLGFEDIDSRTLRPVGAPRSRQLSLREPYGNRTTLWGLDVEYDFGWARLNSITSAQDTQINGFADLTKVYGPPLRALGYPLDSVGVNSNVEQHRVSQEFRLTSRSGTDIEWLAGLYLNRERSSVNGGIDANLAAGLGSRNLLTSSQAARYRETAAYGDVTWNATSALSLTGGVRVARNHVEYNGRSSGLLVGPTASTGGGESSDDPVTYLATAKYALDKNSNVYFRAASGYRPGGPNDIKPGADRSLVQPMFRSDSLWSYELGYKADLLDRTLSVEGALYDLEWKNIQQPLRTGGFTYVTNAGKARIQGAELALAWRPSPQWRVNGSLSTIDGKLLTDAAGLGAKAGSRLPDTARLSFVAGVTRNFKIDEHDAYVGISARYTGARNAGYAGSAVSPLVKMPAYTLVDLQAGIDFKRFSIAAYVRNLTNQRGILSIDTGSSSPLTPYVTQAALTLPRTIGMTVTVPF